MWKVWKRGKVNLDGGKRKYCLSKKRGDKMASKSLKTMDMFVWILLTIGGLNWGLMGFFNFNIVPAIFGEGSVFIRLVYGLVGLAGLYEVASIKAISRRWKMHFGTPAGV